MVKFYQQIQIHKYHFKIIQDMDMLVIQQIQTEPQDIKPQDIHSMMVVVIPSSEQY